MLSYKYDIGLHIVPKHIFEGQDWTTFAAFDLAKDWPVTTGPWKVVNVSPTQKVIDRRDSWWGVAAGVGKLPAVERIVLLPDAGEQQLAQGLISNAVDFSTGLQVATFPTVFDGNPNITTFTGRDLPWGNVDWWPTSLYLVQAGAIRQSKFRWAVSYMIDRQTLIDGLGGSSSLSPLPMTDGAVYKGLEPYFESAKPLLEKFPTNEFSPDKAAALMEELGWKKDGDGLYQDPTGKPFTLEIISFFDFPSVGPVLVELLRRQGLNATYGQPPDMFDRFFSGDFNASIFGHGGSVRDPYETLRLYQSSASPLPGGQAQHLVNLAQWNNKVRPHRRQVFRPAPTDTAKMQDLWLKAMAIWLPSCPTSAHAVLSPPPDEPDLLKGYPTKDNPTSTRPSSIRPTGWCCIISKQRPREAGKTHHQSARRLGRSCLFSISLGGSAFLLIIWTATVSFFLPGWGQGLVAQKLMQTARRQSRAGMKDMGRNTAKLA